MNYFIKKKSFKLIFANIEKIKMDKKNKILSILFYGNNILLKNSFKILIKHKKYSILQKKIIEFFQKCKNKKNFYQCKLFFEKYKFSKKILKRKLLFCFNQINLNKNLFEKIKFLKLMAIKKKYFVLIHSNMLNNIYKRKENKILECKIKNILKKKFYLRIKQFHKEISQKKGKLFYILSKLRLSIYFNIFKQIKIFLILKKKKIYFSIKNNKNLL